MLRSLNYYSTAIFTLTAAMTIKKTTIATPAGTIKPLETISFFHVSERRDIVTTIAEYTQATAAVIPKKNFFIFPPFLSIS